jgi:hypothetical protein
MKVIPTEEIEWETVVANARAGHVQRKHVREGEILPGVGYASDCYNYVSGDGVFTAPRHHHDFEQIRISIKGVQDFGLGQITTRESHDRAYTALQQSGRYSEGKYI